jgi:hypothetical protein
MLLAGRTAQQLRFGYPTCLLALVAITFPHWFHGPGVALLATALLAGVALQLLAVCRAVLAHSSPPGPRQAGQQFQASEDPDLLIVAISVVLANVAAVVVFST